jgi:hypothetical protein
MKLDPERLAWAAIATGTAYLAGRAIESAARHGWKSVTGEEPPEHPESTETGWKDALIWTAATSLTLGVGRLLAQRIAAFGWEQARGDAPPA